MSDFESSQEMSSEENPNPEIIMEDQGPQVISTINNAHESKSRNPKNFTTEVIYENIKKKIPKPPSFNNSSDFIEESSTSQSAESQDSMQLIKISQGKIVVCEEARGYLKKLTKKFGVISIAGPARTGKSLLLNLFTKKKIFQVGSRVQACTQGIWITPLSVNNRTLLLVDSEGSKSVEKTETFDAKIFAILILMSSVFIYNSKGVIDERSVGQLTLATHVSEMISFKLTDTEDENSTKARICSNVPKFVWLLRDFHLSLVDQNENSTTPKQYMENVLGMKKFHGRNAEKNAKIREKFVEVFEDRTCFTLPRPADQEADLENLNSLPLENLRPKFLKSFKIIEKSILENCPLKSLNGVEVNGLQLLVFIEEIIKCVNEGVMPNLHTAWNQVIIKQYENCLEEAKVKYKENRDVNVESMPYEESELIFKLQTAKDLALQGLRDLEQKDVYQEENAKEEFEIFFQDDLRFTLDTNFSASEAYNLSLIDRIFRGIIKKLNEGGFHDNFETFEKEWVGLMKEYERLAKGPGKLIAITEFSRKYQHNSFSKFYQMTTDNYEQEIKELRQKQKEYQEKLYEQVKENKDDFIEKHVISIQISRLEGQIGIKDPESLEKLLQKIRTTLFNNK